MNLTNYLTNLSITALNLGTDLAYGYGNLAATEINSLKDLLSKAEEMIPVIETEACMAEAEELDREDRSFNYWMTMLYGKGDVISSMDSHNSTKANHLKRRKQNKKNKERDRIHGRRHGGAHGGIDFRYVDCNPYVNKHRYEDAMFAINGKHRHNANRKASAMDAREKDYILSPDPIKELWNAYWLHRDAECRLNHKADEPLFMHRTQGVYEEAIKEWEKLTEEEYNTFLEVDSLLYSLGLDWNYFD